MKSPPRKRCGCSRPSSRLASVTVGCSAAAITDRAGIGSGRFGPDAKGSAGVEARDGASAGAYSMYVEHGHADGEAGNLGLAAGAGFAVNQRNIGGSAAHVERDDSVESAAARHGRGAYHAACRSGEHGAHRLARSRTESGYPAARLHDKDARPRPAIEVLEITLHDGLQIRVHHYRAGALVLAKLGKNLVGDRQGNAELLQFMGNGKFRLWVGERKQQRDGNGLGMLLLNFPGQGLQVLW